jgi:hypothetical protein
MQELPIEFGANLFIWIVCILIGFVAALSFIDVRTVFGPRKPVEHADDHSEYWKSRKHAEDVHREFPREKPVQQA